MPPPKKSSSSISTLTITAGGMQNKRAIIVVYAYTFVLSIPVCEKESYLKQVKEENGKTAG